MNAKSQIHAKMADNVRTHMEAMNANVRLDLPDETAKQVGQNFDRTLSKIDSSDIRTGDLRDFN